MGGERRAGNVLAPCDEALGVQCLRVELQRRPALPERHVPPGMDDRGGVGGVHVVGPPRVRRVGRHGAERRQQAPPGRGLPAALGRVENARPVGRGRAVEAEGLHHAVAVEPVAVAVAEAVMLGRAVAPERAGELGREPAAQRLQRRGEAFRLRRGEGERLVFAGSAGCARGPGGEQQRQASGGAERVPAGHLRFHGLRTPDSRA